MKKKYYLLHPYSINKLLKTYNMPFDFEEDENNPDYLIATVLIYTDPIMWNKFVELYPKAKVCIYFAGECVAPDLNLFDYAIVFDKNLYCEDRIIRMPTSLFFDDMIFASKNSWVGKEREILAEKQLLKEKSFCNYIYSNGWGHKSRTDIFYLLNKYKKVDSWGEYLHNVEDCLKVQVSQGWRSMIEESISVKSNYKFSIAFENATYNGYTSEKIFSSLEAHTVPIYWGNPLIAEELNKEAFINCHNYDSFEEVVEVVKQIDNDDELWTKMVCSPWKTDEQEKEEQDEIIRYFEFLNNIFNQPIDKARRRGDGFHPKNYEKWFFQSYKFEKYHEVEIKWIESIRMGRKIETYFANNNYSRVVIYGMSQLGVELYYELKNSDNVEVLYGIDQGKISILQELKIYDMDELLKLKPEIPDVVIVAVPHLFNMIEYELRKVFSCEVIPIIKIVEN